MRTLLTVTGFFGPKSSITGLNGLLKIGFKRGLLDQPNQTDLETSQLATPQQPADVLQAVPAAFSSSLDGDVIVHHKGS